MQYRHRTNPDHKVSVVRRSFGSVSYVAAGASVVSSLPIEDFDRNYEPASEPVVEIPVSPAPLARYQDRRDPNYYVEVHGRKNGVVIFCPQGGGFQSCLLEELFDALYALAPEPTYIRGTVTADWLPDNVSLPCISNGDHWNGWAMPYFDRDTVNELVALMPDTLRWRDEREYEVVTITSDPDEEEQWSPEMLTLANGEQVVELWGIGAGSWCWTDFEPDPKEAAQMLLGEMDKAYEQRHVTAPDPMIGVRRDALRTVHAALGTASSVDALCDLDLHPDLVNQFVDAVAKAVGDQNAS